jgi:hypothetical protein
MIEPFPVCVFAKPPRPGESKTRIGHAFGDLFAARLASALLADTWALVKSLPWARPILATTTSDVSLFGLEGPVELWPQGTGDLGARMERVLARAVSESGRGIVIGADLPGLPLDRLIGARTALESHDAVLGPARDGGFYLIGMRMVPGGVLAELPWSAADTLARTEQRFGALGVRATRLSPWFDVDRPEDVPIALSFLEASPLRAPKTLQVLRMVGAA